MHTESKFVRVARHFAHDVFLPINSGCCGMAGDRGFLFPELTASATSHEATGYTGKEFDAYYSSTQTCELAMSQAIGKNFESILYLADECL
jgi:D-lactate dehydrogenase